MAVVTVPGAPFGTTLTYTFNNTFNASLAQKIANAMAAASSGGSLNAGNVATVDGSGNFPANTVGGTGELVMTSASGAPNTGPAVLSGYSYLIDSPGDGPDAMGTGAGVSVLGGDGNHTVNVADVVVLGDGEDVVNETDPTVTFNVAVGNGSNTLVGSSSGTLAGGTGTNLFNLSGEPSLANVLVMSQGTGDTIDAGAGHASVGDSILAGAGSATVDASGATSVGNTIRASTGALTVNESGRKGRIIGTKNTSTLTVNNTGKAMQFFGGTGTNTVIDSGSGTTINAGTGSNFVTLQGGGTPVFGAASGGALSVFELANGSLVNDSFGATGDLNVDLADSAPGAVVTGQSVSNITVSAATHNAFIYGAGTTVTSALNVDDQGTNSAVVALSTGAFNVTAAGSGSDFFAGSANANMSVSGTGNLINAVFGTGALNATVSGSANNFVVGNSSAGGSITLTSTAGSNNIYTTNNTSGAVNIIDGGTNDLTTTNYANGGTANVTASGSGDTIIAGAAQTNVTAQGSGGVTVLNLGGNLNFVGGSGSAAVEVFGFFSPGAGGNTIFGGSDGSNINYVYGGTGTPGALTYTAGSGNETLTASSSSTNDTLGAGTGSVTITGGTGSDLYLFDKNVIDAAGTPTGASDVVNNLNSGAAGTEVLLANYGATAAETALAGAITSAGNTTIVLADGTSITFNNTSKAQLTTFLHST